MKSHGSGSFQIQICQKPDLNLVSAGYLSGNTGCLIQFGRIQIQQPLGLGPGSRAGCDQKLFLPDLDAVAARSSYVHGLSGAVQSLVAGLGTAW